MPEAIAEPPAQTAAAPQPQQPLTAEIPESLRNLLDKVLPADGGLPEKQPVGEPVGEPVAEPAKSAADTTAATGAKVEKPAVVPGDPRLAPDFEAGKKEDAPPAEPEIEITDEMIEAEKSPKKQADMRKFRDSFNQLKGEVARLKAAPPVKAEDPGTAEIIEQQRTQLAQLSTQLERVNIQAHPLFQQQFIQPRERMLGDAIEVVKEVGGDPEAFERAMALTGKNKIAALDEFVEDIKSPLMREKLGRLIDGIDGKDREIAAALKDSKGLKEKLRIQETMSRHEQLAQQEKTLVSLLDQAGKHLSENMKLEVLQKQGTPEFKWWDDQADTIAKNAREALLNATPQEMAVLAWLGTSAGAYRNMWYSERQARHAAEKRLADIDGADPDLPGRAPKPASNSEFGPDADITQVALAKLRRGDYNSAT